MSVADLIQADQLLAAVRSLCTGPSTAARPNELTATAARTEALMRNAGLHIQQIETDGPPVMVGYKTGRSPVTLMLYHHYDVAPSGPWRSWNHEPFQVAERDDLLFGRGVAVGKGPLAAHLTALAALKGQGELPCGVIVVAEGRGLSGSAGLAQALAHLPQRADFCLGSQGEQNQSSVPFCYSGVKGLLQVNLVMRTPSQPLPVGLAASVRNPLWRLIWALGSIKTEDEALQIEGFEEEIEPLSREESQALRTLKLHERLRLQSWQLDGFLFEMHGSGLLRTEATLPSCNVSLVSSEPSGDFSGIPTSATARLDFCLVPRQQPSTIVEHLRQHLDKLGFADIATEPIPGGYPAAHSSINDPFLRLLSVCGADVYGTPLPLLPMGYFPLPLALISNDSRTPVASVGCAAADTGSVGANEHIPIKNLVNHAALLITLMNGLGQ